VPPTQITCANHEGENPAIMIQQWNGSEYEMVTDWIPAMAELTRPLVEQEAAAYAKEQGIPKRDCS